MAKSNEQLVHDTLSTLSREFVVVGKTLVRSWHAWLAIGVVVGIFTGVLYVANRSGEVEKSSAQVPPLPTPSTEYNLAIAKNPLATGGIGKTLANKKVDQTFTAPSDLPLQSVKLEREATWGCKCLIYFFIGQSFTAPSDLPLQSVKLALT